MSTADKDITDQDITDQDITDQDITDQDITDSNDYINQVTLNFLISKTQLQKLNKKMNNEIKNEPIVYDKPRILELFNKLLNNERPDDLLEDVRLCFDAFIEKSIYYIDIHDKNAIIEKDRSDNFNDDFNEDFNEDFNDDLNEGFKEEPIIKVNVIESRENTFNWFNTTRQKYKMGQICPRKKETIIDNSI
jgi:hypothetical protein